MSGRLFSYINMTESIHLFSILLIDNNNNFESRSSREATDIFCIKKKGVTTANDDDDLLLQINSSLLLFCELIQSLDASFALVKSLKTTNWIVLSKRLLCACGMSSFFLLFNQTIISVASLNMHNINCTVCFVSLSRSR